MASVDNTTQSWGAGANLTFPSFGPPIDRCKNEHPRQGFSSGNRFGALSGGGFGMFIVISFHLRTRLLERNVVVCLEFVLLFAL